jgi:hypothetical protein
VRENLILAHNFSRIEKRRVFAVFGRTRKPKYRAIIPEFWRSTFEQPRKNVGNFGVLRPFCHGGGRAQLWRDTFADRRGCDAESR